MVYHVTGEMESQYGIKFQQRIGGNAFLLMFFKDLVRGIAVNLCYKMQS